MQNDKKEVVKLNIPKVTGIVKFQFDDNEPIQLTTLMDNGEFTITIKRTRQEIQREQQEKTPFLINNYTHLEFRDKDGRTFKIFIDEP